MIFGCARRTGAGRRGNLGRRLGNDLGDRIDVRFGNGNAGQLHGLVSTHFFLEL